MNTGPESSISQVYFCSFLPDQWTVGLRKRPKDHRLLQSSMMFWHLFQTIRSPECSILPSLNTMSTSDLSSKSPNARVIANWPATLPFKISPPYFLSLIKCYLIRYCSLGFVTLWSIVTLRAVVPSMHKTARVSPKLAMWQVLFAPDFLTKTKQQVEPVSLAPTSFSCSSALAQTLSKTSFRLFFSLAYYWEKSYH